MGLEDFEITGDLGKGSFGSVVRCIRRSDGEIYAMKQVLFQFIQLRSNCKNSRIKIKTTRLIKLDFLPLYRVNTLLTTRKHSTTSPPKSYASSWSSLIKATFKVKSKKQSPTNRGFQKVKSGVSLTKVQKVCISFTRRTLSIGISNLQTYFSTMVLLKQVISTLPNI